MSRASTTTLLLIPLAVVACGGPDYSDPPAREGHAMAFDAARDQVVMFGGINGNGVRADTWTWDGTGWVLVTIDGPSPRIYSALAYDRARERVVLFGGNDRDNVLSGETWEWDGGEWIERTPPTSPSARAAPAMAYDEVRERIVLFGGTNQGFEGLADTWEWDGETWIERSPPTTPSPGRYSHAMDYDPSRDRIVMFGGTGIGELSGLAAVWEWDGETWTGRSIPGPPVRRGAPMAFDGARMIVHGGLNIDDNAGADTWAFDGDTWADLTPAGTPGARAFHAMAFDAARGEIVMFGGSAGNAPVADTQLWNGTEWRPVE